MVLAPVFSEVLGSFHLLDTPELSEMGRWVLLVLHLCLN